MPTPEFQRQKLTTNFSRWEFTVSETAARRDIPNSPSQEHWLNLKALSELCLEPAREALGGIRITSGYRCKPLNDAIGGAPNSQHIKGEAADIIPVAASLPVLFLWLYNNAPFDQIIWEFGQWIHISHKRDSTQRHESLLAQRHNGSTVYAPITQEHMDKL